MWGVQERGKKIKKLITLLLVLCLLVSTQSSSGIGGAAGAPPTLIAHYKFNEETIDRQDRGDVFYVSATGAGAKDGTSYADRWDGFGNIVWGTNAGELGAGDTLYVCGTVQEELETYGSGTSGSEILIRGDYPSDRGVIDGDDTVSQVLDVNHDYIIFEKLDIKGSTTSNVAISSDEVTFRYCLIHDIKGFGGSGNNISTSGGDVYFYNCNIYGSHRGIYAANNWRVTVRNCIIVGNSGYGIYAYNEATVDYDYNLFFANSITTVNFANEIAKDGTGTLTDGGHNVFTDPGWKKIRYEEQPGVAFMNFSIDDVGFSGPSNTYVDDIRGYYEDRGIKLDINVVTGTADIDTELATWNTAGHKINSHSWSHQYFTSLNGFTISCTDAAATMTITGNALTTSTTVGGADDLNIDLTNNSYDEIGELVDHINGLTGYSCIQHADARTTCHTVGLADVTDEDITGAGYLAQIDKQRMIEDELATSKAWLATKGITTTTYIWPGGRRDSDTISWANAAGYNGVRGIDYAYDYWNLASYGIYGICSLNPAGLTTDVQIEKMIDAGAFYSKLFHVIITYYAHSANECAVARVPTLLDRIIQKGQYVNLPDIIAFIRGNHSTADGGITWTETYTADANHRLKPDSPCISAGVDVGLSSDYGGNPIRGIPDIGAHELFVLDSSGNNHRGSAYRDLIDIHVVGKIRGAFDFTPNDFIEIADHDDFSPGDGSTGTPFSISAWVYMHDATNFCIASKGVEATDGEWRFYTDGSDKLLIHCYDENINKHIGRKFNSALTQNVWTHLVATYDGGASSSGLKLYRNSIQIDDTDDNAATFIAVENLTHAVYIGRYDTSYANGLIDNVMFFGVELTPDEVKRLYNNRNGTEILQEIDPVINPRRSNTSPLALRKRYEN